jgi:hypothetical protein
MTTATAHFQPGNLVRARGREWVVQADSSIEVGGSLLRLRPLGGSDEDTIALIPELEFTPVVPATFPCPDATQPGNHAAALLMRCVRAVAPSARLATSRWSLVRISWCHCSWPCASPPCAC